MGPISTFIENKYTVPPLQTFVRTFVSSRFSINPWLQHEEMCGWGDGEELIMKSWCSEYKCWCRSATPTSLTDEDTGNKVKGSRERPPTWEINISRRWSNLLSPVSTQEVRVWVWLWSPCFSIILLLWTKEAHSTHSVYLFHSYYTKSRSQQSIFQDGGVQEQNWWDKVSIADMSTLREYSKLWWCGGLWILPDLQMQTVLWASL